MISFTVRMRFAPEDRQEVIELLLRLAEASRQEPGCLAYIPHRVEGDPDTFLLYEQYADKASELAHRQSPHFAKYAVGGIYQKVLDRNREDLDAIL